MTEQERTDNAERRQDFPGAVIAGYNDGGEPDMTPIPDPPGWDRPMPAELPYGETEPVAEE